MQQLVEPGDQIVDILKAARLLPLAVDRQRLAFERLHDEIGHYPAVADAHARPVGVKNAHDPRVETVKPMIRHGHRFGKSFGLVVNAARSDGIDVAPVLFTLRPHQRIAIDFRSRSEQICCAFGFGQAEGVVGAQGAHFQSRNRQLQIIDGTCRRGEVQDEVQRFLDFNIPANVVIDEAETGIFLKLADIFVGAGGIVIHAQDLVPLIEKMLAKVRADKTRAAGNQISSHDFSRSSNK